MIHLIPHHIKKGSYAPWYSLIDFKDDVIIHEFDNKLEIERAKFDNGNLPYYNELINQITKINPNTNDIVICDVQHFPCEEPYELQIKLKELSNKFKIKIVSVDDDNRQPYEDTEFYTIFSNKFQTDVLSKTYNLNYYRYRAAKEDYFSSIENIVPHFWGNLRQKKCNLIIGVDKIERLEIFKYTHNIGLDKDTYLAYSGFASNYDDSEISPKLREWKSKNIPTILDTSFKKSQEGTVNPQIPPIPFCLNSYVSCIMETQILEKPYVHLSEKSWNPFISMNIPLILGSEGINDYLKEMGFWMANDLFDLSFVRGKTNILKQYKSNLDIINKMSKLELHDYYTNNYRSIERNYNLMGKQKFVYDSKNYKQPNYK